MNLDGSNFRNVDASGREQFGRLLGLDHAYSVAKKTYMATDATKGAPLALEIGPTLEGIHQRDQARACERRYASPNDALQVDNPAALGLFQEDAPRPKHFPWSLQVPLRRRDSPVVSGRRHSQARERSTNGGPLH